MALDLIYIKLIKTKNKTAIQTIQQLAKITIGIKSVLGNEYLKKGKGMLPRDVPRKGMFIEA